MSSEGPTDRELLERYVAGDARAFDLIVDRYERRVYAIALRMCGDPDDARDVSQTVFINALRALPGFREEAQLSTWFHRVAVNASLDHLRKQKRQPTDPLDSVGDRPSEGPSPEDRAVSAVRAAEVQAALRRLSDEHRAVLVLHDIQDLDYAGVAHALDIPVGTVKSRIHRARLELAKLLGHLRETSEGTERSSGPSNKR
ncbi:MAG TPA: sigma-70 family RNA polymerase sigma factor [Actinomycetota bacterium]